MELIVAVLAAAIAGLLQAIVGFGFAVVFVPLMAFAVGARSAVATSLMLGLLSSCVLYMGDRERAPLRSVALLALSATATIPLGVLILARADERLLQGVVGAVVLGSVLLSLRTPHPTHPRAETVLNSVGIGLASGVLRGATSMAGPPVVLYEHWLGVAPAVIRSRLLAFFALTGFAGVAFAYAGGVLTRDSALRALVALPALALAMAAGRWLRPRFADAWFRHLSMGLLLVMGCVALVGAVR